MNALILLTVLSAPCPTPATWPTKAWPLDLDATKAARATEIQALEDYAFTLTLPDSARAGIRTDGLLIIKSGTLIYERYGRRYGPANRHISWSVAKSFTSAMVGVAAAKGALSLDDSMCKYVSAREDECPITVRHLLEFGSGLHWQEGYENDTHQESGVLAMLFGEGHRDMVGFTLGHKKEAEPGTRWQYSTGESTVLAEVARQAALKKGLGEDWMWTELFDRIGMQNAVFQADPKGAPAGGSYVYATPRDYARFGYLYLQDGCWEGERVLPDGWVKSSVAMSATFKSDAPADEDTPNGWMWWSNEIPPKRTTRPWPDAPVDTYMAIGHWGQFIIVVPSADVIIVRTGDDRDEGIDLNQLIVLSLGVAR